MYKHNPILAARKRLAAAEDLAEATYGRAGRNLVACWASAINLSLLCCGLPILYKGH